MLFCGKKKNIENNTDEMQNLNSNDDDNILKLQKRRLSNSYIVRI